MGGLELEESYLAKHALIWFINLSLMGPREPIANLGEKGMCPAKKVVFGSRLVRNVTECHAYISPDNIGHAPNWSRACSVVLIFD